ncbi:hypothetical protein Csa_004232 [Cucumis sativus]|nr:hypothetical protein Csa_004232 [Cucumis sativus]
MVQGNILYKRLAPKTPKTGLELEFTILSHSPPYSVPSNYSASNSINTQYGKFNGKFPQIWNLFLSPHI